MEALIPNLPQSAALLVWFLVVYALLKRWLFEPYLDVLDRRFADTEGAVDAFAEIEADIETAAASRKQRLDEARSQAHEKREQIIAAAAKEAGAILDQGKQAAKAKLDEALAAVQAAEAEARRGIDSEIGDLAALAADRLVAGKAA